MPIFICALPNSKRAGRIPSLISDSPAAIEEFARRWDKPGYGVFRCVSVLKPGACRRSLESVGEIDGFYVDIDAKDVIESMAEISKRLAGLPLPPSELRNSGHGLHAVWRFKEVVSTDDAGAAAQATELLKRLTIFLCGDMAVAHPAALLREPGTHNSKNNEWLEVTYAARTNRRYDLFEFADWLDDVEGRTLFTRRETGNGHDKSATASAPEHKPRIDVEARLAAMKFEGPGEHSIHQTQLSITASLLRDGVALEEITRIVLAATRASVAGNPQAADWNWRREELTILRMGVDFIAKHPELVVLLPDKWRQPFEAALAVGRRPDIGLNPGGFYVRAWKIGPTNNTGSPAIEVDPETLHKARSRSWSYYDHTEMQPQRWCVKQLIPETGVGIVSGQWGSFKTTAALDLSVSVMTGKEFAGQYRIKRKGAVLYFATEGAGTLQSRLTAIARHRGAPDKLPFAWRSDCPMLTDKSAGATMVKMVDEAAVHFEHAYGVPITLIWVDTYITAAGLNSSGDDNDAAATQKAFSTLRFVAAHTKAFVMTVDHLGKAIEAGTRGSSGKEGNADTVLATLADREITGAVANARMAARKQRDGISGFEVPFTPEMIDLGLDEDGDPVTAIVLRWNKQRREQPAKKRRSKDVELLCRVLAETVAKRGFAFQPDPLAGRPCRPAMALFCVRPSTSAATPRAQPSKNWISAAMPTIGRYRPPRQQR
jgi:hypothetical protein